MQACMHALRRAGSEHRQASGSESPTDSSLFKMKRGEENETAGGRFKFEQGTKEHASGKQTCTLKASLLLPSSQRPESNFDGRRGGGLETLPPAPEMGHLGLIRPIPTHDKHRTVHGSSMRVSETQTT